MMKRSKKRCSQKGFTLIELLVVASSAAILTIVMGVLLSNGQKSWNRLYEHTYGNETTDGFAVQKVFAGICRKSSLTHYKISSAQDSLELYYWDANSSSEIPENYARFYLSGDDLYIEHGKLQSDSWKVDSSEQSSSLVLAQDVESIKFEMEGLSVQMFLTYQDPEVMPVICSSVRHNK